MRNTVASHYGGHALEKRFLDMDFLELRILYEQAMRDKKKTNEDKWEMIKMLNEFWVENFNVHFENLLMFTNPEAYKMVQEMKDIEGLRGEIDAEDFPEMWNDLMDILPNECIVSDIEADHEASIPVASPEMDEVFSGWESQSRFDALNKFVKEDPVSGWDSSSTTGFTPINEEG
jgi:hypothetical protein